MKNADEIIIRIDINSARTPPNAYEIGIKPPAIVPIKLNTFPLISCGTAIPKVAPINEFKIALVEPTINPSTIITGNINHTGVNTAAAILIIPKK